MRKTIDVILGLGLNFFVFMLWISEMVIASDIPVEVSYKNFITISMLLVLCLIIFSFYIRNTKNIRLNTQMILIPLLLWFVSMQQALNFHYHEYDTIIDISGFSVTLVLFFQLVYRRKKNIT